MARMRSLSAAPLSDDCVSTETRSTVHSGAHVRSVGSPQLTGRGFEPAAVTEEVGRVEMHGARVAHVGKVRDRRARLPVVHHVT
eukprot:3627425-Prymnesium_polylepis.2